MTMTITVTPDGGSAITYAENDWAVGRYARAFKPSAPIHDIRRYEVPGVDGSFVLRAGNRGRLLSIVVRYIDTIDNVYSQWNSDMVSMAGVQSTVSGPITIQGLSLLHSQCAILTEPKPTGRGEGIVFIDAIIHFREDLHAVS